MAGGWTAMADDDGDCCRGRRGAVAGDKVHLLVLLLHVRLHKFILLSHEIFCTDCSYC